MFRAHHPTVIMGWRERLVQLGGVASPEAIPGGEQRDLSAVPLVTDADLMG